MKCVICKTGSTVAGNATVTLERGSTVVVVKSVPAQICDNCGERYYDEKTSDQLLMEIEKASRSGVQVEVRSYAAA